MEEETAKIARWYDVGPMVSPQAKRRRQIAEFVSVVFVLGLFPSLVAAVYFWDLGGLYCWLFLVLVGVCWLVNWRSTVLREGKWADFCHDQSVLDALGECPRWVVYIRIVQGWAITGEDRGALWLDEGRLCFSGEYCSFVVTPDLLFPRSQRQRMSDPRFPGITYTHRLYLRSPKDGKRVLLTFVEAAEAEGHCWPADGLKRILLEFTRAEALHDVSEFPPLDRGPGGMTILGLIWQMWWYTVLSMVLAGVSYGIGILISSMILRPAGAEFGPAAAFAFFTGMFLLFMALFGVFHRSRAITSLIRMEWKSRQSRKTRTMEEG